MLPCVFLFSDVSQSLRS